MHARSVVKVLMGGRARGVLERELLPADRIMKRWAVAVGSGLPTDVWDDTPIARVPPLDDAMAVIVDRIVCKCPPKTKRILHTWYRKPLPTEELAADLHMSESSLYVAWRLSLSFVKWRCLESNYSPLVKLVSI